MSDAALTHEPREEGASAPPGAAIPPRGNPIVPADSIAGRALVAVIAIMTFLAALMLGAVVLVRAASSEWQSDVAREVTIQVKPSAGRNIEADVAKAAEIATGLAGVAGVRPYSKAESARLLEPWLGSGLSLNDLPVPRLIVVRLTSDGIADLAALAKALADQIPGAALDDHRGWIERMRTMGRTSIAIGFGLLLLVLAAPPCR